MMKKDGKTLYIVVDAVNGFMKEGNLADSYIFNIVPTIIRVLTEIKQKDDYLFFANDKHDALKSTELKNFKEHCCGGWESQTVDELIPFEKEANGVFYKNNICSVLCDDFREAILALDDIEEVVVMGCCTDLCVMYLAILLVLLFHQHNRNINVTVYKEAVQTFNDDLVHRREEYNEMAFREMQRMGVQVKTLGKGDI